MGTAGGCCCCCCDTAAYSTLVFVAALLMLLLEYCVLCGDVFVRDAGDGVDDDDVVDEFALLW